MAGDFGRSMILAFRVLGQAAFRRWPPGEKRRGPINRAVFESQALAFANCNIEQALRCREAITTSFRSLFTDERYLKSVTVATGDPASIAERLDHTRKAIEEAMK